MADATEVTFDDDDHPPGLPRLSDPQGQPIRLIRVAKLEARGAFHDLRAQLAEQGIETFAPDMDLSVWVMETDVNLADAIARRPRAVLPDGANCPKCGSPHVTGARFSTLQFIGGVLSFMWWHAWDQLSGKSTCDECFHRWRDTRGFEPTIRSGRDR